jgi:hypothetical protein
MRVLRSRAAVVAVAVIVGSGAPVATFGWWHAIEADVRDLREARRSLQLRIEQHEAERAVRARMLRFEPAIAVAPDAAVGAGERVALAIPPTAGVAEVLASLEELARGSAVSVTRIEAPKSAQLGRQAYRILGFGTLTALTRFVAGIERQPRVLVVHTTTLQAFEDGSVDAEIVVVAHHDAGDDK